MRIHLALLALLLAASCQPAQKELKAIGDHSITVFDTANIHFHPDYSKDMSADELGIYHLDAGRVILKKVKLPNFEKQPDVELEVTLTSNGDPWDKSGSFFVIPNTTDINLLDIETSKFKLKNEENPYVGVVPFTSDSAGKYIPNVELLRFMTPFGVGHFSNDERVVSRKPLYVPKWEEEVVWKQNLTHLLPLLEGEVYLGAFIDTWTGDGYKISATLNFKESKIRCHEKASIGVHSLVNTVKYSASQVMYDHFSQEPLTLDFEIPNTYKNARLYYTTTGHGGHSEGDEFNKEENIVSFDGKVVKQFIPWRDDCASFRRFNPTSGIWVDTVTYEGRVIDERIASSDFSRSNWCPGSDVSPEIIDLGDLPSGNHSIKIDIPKAQVGKENEYNYWMVSAYLVYDQVIDTEQE